MVLSRTIRVCILLGISMGVIVVSLLFLKGNNPDPASREIRPTNTRAEPADGKNARTAEAEAEGPAGSTAGPEARVAALIRDSAQSFRANRDPAQASILLRELRNAIRQASEEAAAAAIVAFLKTGDDAPTGLPFAVGADGMMESVPTLRLALLDLLPSLDPLAALDVARAVMDQRTSADEYALALRNLAWNDLDGDLRNELSGRFMDLLKSGGWLDQPSAGFLEAFDIAVEVGGGPMFDRMAALAGEATAKANTAASRAAFMSLDRMVVRDPGVLVNAFEAGWMDFAPQQRASLLSRLDITRPDQREIFNRYLSSNHAAGELDYFTKIFPNGNYLFGHRLVTADEATPTIAEVAAADARVVAVLDVLEAQATGEAGAAIRTIRERLK